MNDKKKDKREQLAIMCACRGFLYYANILTDVEAEKVYNRIKRFQEKHKINISPEQLNSIEFIYKD